MNNFFKTIVKYVNHLFLTTSYTKVRIILFKKTVLINFINDDLNCAFVQKIRTNRVHAVSR